MFDSKLKGHSVEKIQEVIGKALSELTGSELECQISSLEFEGICKARLALSVGIPMKNSREEKTA